MRKRSKYRPKPVNPLGGLQAIAKHQWMTDEMATELVVAARSQFDALRRGQGHCEMTCNTLAQLVNVSLILCEMGVGSLFMNDIKCAQNWLAKTFDRGNRTGTWILDGAAFGPISQAIEIHDQQLRNSRRGEVVQAMETVLKRLDNGDVIEVTR